MTRTTKASPPRFDEDLPAAPLTDTDVRLVDAYWRAANYLSVGQVYLLDEPTTARAAEPSTSSRGCLATSGQPPASTWSTCT